MRWRGGGAGEVTQVKGTGPKAPGELSTSQELKRSATREYERGEHDMMLKTQADGGVRDLGDTCSLRVRGAGQWGLTGEAKADRPL